MQPFNLTRGRPTQRTTRYTRALLMWLPRLLRGNKIISSNKGYEKLWLRIQLQRPLCCNHPTTTHGRRLWKSHRIIVIVIHHRRMLKSHHGYQEEQEATDPCEDFCCCDIGRREEEEDNRSEDLFIDSGQRSSSITAEYLSCLLLLLGC